MADNLYRALGLPPTCSNCSLSSNRFTPIWGQSSVPLTQVSGIIISAYPGKEEVASNMTLVAAASYLNAGGFLRMVMRGLTKNPTIDDNFFFTNAISCFPNKARDKDVDLSVPIKKCSSWTQLEIARCRPNCPILIASSEAVTQLFGKAHNITNSRNETLQYEGHPCIVTWNPAVALRYSPKDERGNYIMPTPRFSHSDLFKTDLIRFLKLAGVL